MNARHNLTPEHTAGCFGLAVLGMDLGRLRPFHHLLMPADPDGWREERSGGEPTAAYLAHFGNPTPP